MGKKKSKKSSATPFYHFRLFIAGDEPNSRMAKETLKNICDTYLQGNYSLELIDVLEDYNKALENNIYFAPTLIINTHASNFRIVGSLSDTRKLLEILGLSQKEKIIEQ